MMISDNFVDRQNETYEKALTSAISAIILNAGFEKSDAKLLDILNEMLQTFLIEVGKLSKNYAEHASRTQPMFSDVFLSLVEMGIDLVSLPQYFFKEQNKIAISQLQQTFKPPEIKCLKSGIKDHFNYIPDYFPELPDRRTYTSTSINSLKKEKDVTESEREKHLIEKRNIQKAYTQYIAKTGKYLSLFNDDQDEYKVITDENEAFPIPPYVSALLGKYSHGPFERFEQASNMTNCTITNDQLTALFPAFNSSSLYQGKDGYCYSTTTNNDNDIASNNTNSNNVVSNSVKNVENSTSHPNPFITTTNKGAKELIEMEKKNRMRKAAILSALKLTEEKRKLKMGLPRGETTTEEAQVHDPKDGNSTVENEAGFETNTLSDGNDIREKNDLTIAETKGAETLFSTTRSVKIENSSFIESLMHDNPYVRLYERRKNLPQPK